MDNLTEHLLKLSDSLDSAGKTNCADAIDGLMETKSIVKLAQYVGVIGYVLKQNRAMGNCIRKKRASNDGSMQEVILDCIKEYQDGQQYTNNEWTSKYAQVVEQCPENFDTSCQEFLKSIAEENNISNHMENIRAVHQVLKDNDINDDLISAAMTDVDRLNKEGDADHRPFKLAAPPSSRGLWSRLWSPTWSRRGQDADTRSEMDRILESIMSVTNSGQQLQTAINSVKSIARRTPQLQEVTKNLDALSYGNWHTTVATIQNLGQLMNSVPDYPQNMGLKRTIFGLSKHIDQMHSQIMQIQQNMNALRTRDPVKGRAGVLSSAADEYGDLANALNRLYRNPLDEKAIYYSQKLHGRLEDALNNVTKNADPTFGDWMNTEEQSASTALQPPVEQPAIGEEPQTAPGQVPSVQGDVVGEIVNLLGMATPEDQKGFVQILDQILGGTPYLDKETESKFRAVRNQLRSNSEMASAPNLSEPQIASPEQLSPATLTQDTATSQNPAPAARTENPNASLDEYFNYSHASSTVDCLIKMADIIDPIDSEMSSVIDQYIAEMGDQEEEIIDFPDIGSILKENFASENKFKLKVIGV